MPNPKSKAARKAALLAPKPSKVEVPEFAHGGAKDSSSPSVGAQNFAVARIVARHSPERFYFPVIHHYSGARAIANEALGLVEHEVTAPMSLAAAMAPEPIGPKSIEYGEPSAVWEDKNNRKPFDAAETLAWCRQMAIERQRDEALQARLQMGDFLDDDDSESARFACGSQVFD